mgnify:CR=1 FL=1
MKSIIKNFLFITLFFLILLIIFVGYKLYNRISIANERIYELELFKTSYQKDKKLHQVYKGLSTNVVREAFNWTEDFMTEAPETYPQAPGSASGV